MYFIYIDPTQGYFSLSVYLLNDAFISIYIILPPPNPR